jgi:hypothetical protein
VNCDKPFVEGDYMQAFLRSPDDPTGSWSKPSKVDAGFQARVYKNDTFKNMKRRHAKKPESKINDSNNFCRVFKLPTKYPEGFLFGGGKPVVMVMVDWFGVFPPDMLDDADRMWESGAHKKALLEFLQQKRYIEAGSNYLVLTDFGAAFTFIGEAK